MECPLEDQWRVWEPTEFSLRWVRSLLLLTCYERTDGRTIENENPKQLHRAYIVVVAALHIAHARRTCLAVGSWRRKRCQEWHSSRRCHLNYFSIWGRNHDFKKKEKKQKRSLRRLTSPFSRVRFQYISSVVCCLFFRGGRIVVLRIRSLNWIY